MRYLATLILFLSSPALAAAISIFAGARGQSANTPPQTDATQEYSAQLGLRASFELSEVLSISSGGQYVRRNIGYRVVDSASVAYNTTGTYEFASVDVPILLSYHFAPYFAVWAGPSLSFSIGSNCKNSSSGIQCRLENVRPLTIPLTLGGTVSVSDRWAFDVFIETSRESGSVFGSFANDVNNYRSVGANLVYTL